MEFNQYSSQVVNYHAYNFSIFNCAIIILYGGYVVGDFMFFWRFLWSRIGKIMLVIVSADDTVLYRISSDRTVRIRSCTVVDVLISLRVFGLVFFKLLQCDHRCVDVTFT